MSIFVVLFLMVINSILVAGTKRPIIGVLAQEFMPGEQIILLPHESSKYNNYIAASYVKAIESSGARVVPIFINQPESYYRWIMKSINGVVIPGGSPPKFNSGSGYYDAFTLIYEIAKEMNKNGTRFPILAICLGFEALFTIANDHHNILKQCNIRHENYPLLVKPKDRESLLFSNIADDALIYLKYFPTTYNNHVWCATPYNFTRSRLPKEWNIVSTSISKRGLKFITSIEHKQYPFIALQFHPEKILFEWNEFVNAPHSKAAIIANRHFYDLLVTLSKLNYNKFESEAKEKEYLIYNYKPIYSNTIPPIFAQLYAF